MKHTKCMLAAGLLAALTLNQPVIASPAGYPAEGKDISGELSLDLSLALSSESVVLSFQLSFDGDLTIDNDPFAATLTGTMSVSEGGDPESAEVIYHLSRKNGESVLYTASAEDQETLADTSFAEFLTGESAEAIETFLQDLFSSFDVGNIRKKDIESLQDTFFSGEENEAYPWLNTFKGNASLDKDEDDSILTFDLSDSDAQKIGEFLLGDITQDYAVSLNSFLCTLHIPSRQTSSDQTPSETETEGNSERFRRL